MFGVRLSLVAICLALGCGGSTGDDGGSTGGESADAGDESTDETDSGDGGSQDEWLYADCAGEQAKAACEATGLDCNRRLLGMMETETLCNKRCETDDDCPPLDGIEARCSPYEICQFPCDDSQGGAGAADCPDGMVCAGDGGGFGSCMWSAE